MKLVWSAEVKKDKKTGKVTSTYGDRKYAIKPNSKRTEFAITLTPKKYAPLVDRPKTPTMADAKQECELVEVKLETSGAKIVD